MFKSLYPSIIHENNIAPNTQIGRIEIDEQIYENENVYKYETYNRGGEFVENMVTDNHIEFCHRWFHLAGIEELINDMDEYFEEAGLGKYSEIDMGVNKALIPISEYYRSPVVFDNLGSIPAAMFTNARNPEFDYETLAKRNIGV